VWFVIKVFSPIDAQLGSLKNNFKFALKLFLRLSNCASIGEKNFDNYQDAPVCT
jgi:hypothetical protein